MKKYIWCEDKKSGYQFWNTIFGILYPDFIVETKESNTKLRHAASRIEADGNLYYILMDNATDNPDVLREIRALKRSIAGKENVREISVHSFEFTLLSFNLLDRWVFAEQDELKEKRRILLDARELFVKLVVSGGNAEELERLKNMLDYPKPINMEKISTRMLYEITRNTGFETDKSKVGPCFITDCCEWLERQKDDICGLDQARLSVEEKMKQLMEHSVLRAAMERAGLA